jgi:hypothetical protein
VRIQCVIGVRYLMYTSWGNLVAAACYALAGLSELHLRFGLSIFSIDRFFQILVAHLRGTCLLSLRRWVLILLFVPPFF